MKTERTAFAVTMVLSGVTIVTATDLLTKGMSSDISLWQLQFMRSAFGLLLLLPILIVIGQTKLIKPQNLHKVLIRCGLFSLTYLAFFISIGALPMALVAGGFFSSPLFMVLLSRLFLNEKAGKWRLFSVFSGFFGVLLILRPDAADFDALVILPVMAGFGYACSQVYTRKYCREEHPLALAFWLTTVFMLSGAAGMLGLFLLPTPAQPDFLTYPLIITDWLITLGMVVLAIGSLMVHFSLAAAYQHAPASLIAPLEYVYMPMAVLGGYLFFDEVPQPTAIFGIGIIIAAGLVIAWRERVQRKQLLHPQQA